MPSRASVAGNSVIAAVEEACALYGVRCYRQQSRAVTVVGAGGRPRPMFVGQWKDRFGTRHTSGMPDLLLSPNIGFEDREGFPVLICAVLWVECKAGTGKLNSEQQAFKEDAEEAGAYYIECHDSAEQVMRWFDAQHVRKR